MIKMAGGHLLVLSHGSPKHVSIPLITGTTRSLDEEVIDTLERLTLIDQEVPIVEAMPESTGPERIAKVNKINEILAKVGIRERPSDPKIAMARLSDFINQSALDIFRAKTAPFIKAMWDLAAKVRQVKSFRFRRIEFRACRVGSNPSLMRKLRQLFDCDVLIAPKFRLMRAIQRTAFSHTGPTFFPERQRYLKRFTPDTSPSMAFCKPCGISKRTMVGQLTSQLTQPASKDGLSDHVVGDFATRRFSNNSGNSVDISIKIVSETPSEFDFHIPKFNIQGTDPNFNIFDLFEVFHRQFVYQDIVIAVQTGGVGGMWLSAQGGYVLVNEPGYLANLITVKR